MRTLVLIFASCTIGAGVFFESGLPALGSAFSIMAIVALAALVLNYLN